jgi:hypothetical protein
VAQGVGVLAALQGGREKQGGSSTTSATLWFMNWPQFVVHV